jgi:outer membrane protein OmpA-like peptidoglycan-associated protein
MQQIATFQKMFLLMVLCIPSALCAQNRLSSSDCALVRAYITDFSGNPRPLEIIHFTTADTLITASSDETGKFTCMLPKGFTWQVHYQTLMDARHYDSLQIPFSPDSMEIKLSLQYETPKNYILRNVHFDTGKSTLKQQSFVELDKLAEVLQQKRTMEIEIAGHTDSIGSDEYNLTLSQSRAESVKAYLVKSGISEDRILASGYGENQPIDSNSHEKGRANNRRTEVRIIHE